MNEKDYQSERYEHAIAIVGMAGKYCGAPTVNDLWNNLENGFEAVRFLDEQMLKDNGCPESILGHPMFVPASAMMTDVNMFDADFFGFTPAEAEIMDPQLRLMFQTAWHAFEDAGLVPSRMDGLTGVFAGGHKSDYLLCNKGPEYSIQAGMQALTASLFNGQDYFSTWLSYKLGLTGPSLNIQTACSTGLVATASACQNLLDYSCDTALVITSAIFNPRDWGYLAETGSILSGDGHCRPYDASATGTITGEGVGAVILKRFRDAIESHDNIQGIIRGYAVNNDGSIRAGYATPGVAGQRELLMQAQAMAGVTSADISYVEGHGTGTNLGDPIEFKALHSVFEAVGRKGPCFLGSIKANLGHLGACAGMVGLQKVLLMLKHGIIPPQINYSIPNPEMDLENSAFQISSQARTWPDSSPRIAGISSFGLGGTNCHMIIEEFENTDTQKWMLQQPDMPLPLCISARSSDSLNELCQKWVEFLQSPDAPSLPQLVKSALSGRTHMPWRIAVTAATPQEATQKLLTEIKADRIALDGEEQSVALILGTPPEGGDEFWLQLFYEAPQFQQTFTACADFCKNIGAPDIMALLQSTPDRSDSCENRLLNFAAQFSLGHFLANCGVPLHIVGGMDNGILAAKALSGASPIQKIMAQLCGRESTAEGKQSEHLLQPLPGLDLVTNESSEHGIEAVARECLEKGVTLFITPGQAQGIEKMDITPRQTPPPSWINLSQSTNTTSSNFFAEALATLYRAGIDISPTQKFWTPGMPLYPFDQKSHWAKSSMSFCNMFSSPDKSRPEDCCEQEAKLQAESPAVSIEQSMVQIWDSALGTTGMGLDEDFFVRGGTSLSAIAIVADIKKLTGLTLELRELMRLRTISGVIERLAELAHEEAC